MSHYYDGSIPFYQLFHAIADAAQFQNHRSLKLEKDDHSGTLIGDQGRIFIQGTDSTIQDVNLSIKRCENDQVSVDFSYGQRTPIQEVFQDRDFIPDYLLEWICPWMEQIQPCLYHTKPDYIKRLSGLIIQKWYYYIKANLYNHNIDFYPIGSNRHIRLVAYTGKEFNTTARFCTMVSNHPYYNYSIAFLNLTDEPVDLYHCMNNGQVFSINPKELLLEQVRKAPIEFYLLFHELIQEIESWYNAQRTRFC